MKRKPVESVGHRRREPARSGTPSCAECDVDRSFLSTQRRPKYETGGKCVRVADVFSVSRRLGHASAAFTMDVYGHLLRGQQHQAAEALDHLLVPG